jgi:hypothetical protein
MKLAAMPACLAGGELGTNHETDAPQGHALQSSVFLANLPLQVRLLPLQQPSGFFLHGESPFFMLYLAIGARPQVVTELAERVQ